MKTISLHDVMPDIFALGDEKSSTGSESDIWMRQVTFVRPEHYLVAAQSGTGKSSLCGFVYGNRSDYQGCIEFDGEDIRKFDDLRWAEIRQRSIALLPQEMRIFPELSVMENIDIKNRLTGFKSRAAIMEMLDRLGIAHKADKPARLLSIGQQQRVAIVRTLCQPFAFLLLDEPVSHLDERNNAVVAEMIEGEASAQGAAIIATSVGNNLRLTNYQTLNL
ncbi:MAG: ATP-binding cassette domain-containing protein [Muribaculaceae bacterium]|nr:ATP-binding cassette domain-containing protein [Muribaculaceae bacterium]